MDDDLTALRLSCERSLTGWPPRVADLLATIPADTEPDVYGDGGVVADLESHVAGLLGAEAAVFLPSGTMAQAATLRVHVDTGPSRTVLWHPTSHLELHEQQAAGRVHGLDGRPVGHATRLWTLADLTSVAERPAAVLWELPAREIGGQLPDWDDLVAQVGWARDRGAATHLDGARLWEASAGYDRPPGEVAGLFDTTYVSFYKGIGALPGCCVAGSSHVVAQVREWRRRLGGTLAMLWPGAASALSRLDAALAEMPARLAHARAIAAALSTVAGVTVLPDPPQTPMMHLLLQATEDEVAARARTLAEQRGIWVGTSSAPTGVPGVVRRELSIDRATMTFTVDEVAGLVAALAGAR